MKKILLLAIVALFSSCSKSPEKSINDSYESLKSFKSADSKWKYYTHEDEMKVDNYSSMSVYSDTIWKKPDRYDSDSFRMSKYASMMSLRVRKMEKDNSVDVLLSYHTLKKNKLQGPYYTKFTIKFDDQEPIVTSKMVDCAKPLEGYSVYFVEDSLKSVMLENIIKSKVCKIKFDGCIYTFNL